MFKKIKKFINYFFGYLIYIFLSNKFQVKLLSLMKPNQKIFLFIKIIRNIYFSFWLKNIYLNIEDPNKRIYFQKICLTGLTVDLDWPKSENAALTDIKSKFIFENIYKIIKNNDIQDKKLVIVQIGSSSGRIIAKISNKFNNINCVGIDFIKEYVEYAKSTYPQSNLTFLHKKAHNINEVLDLYPDSKFIIFSLGSASYMQPEHLKDFFIKISKYNILNFLLAESYYEKNFKKNYSLKPINFKNYSSYNGGMHYSHKYCKFAEFTNLKILHNEINQENNSILCQFKK